MKQQVNYIEHHRAVNFKMAEDKLTAIHISLYNALFIIWNESWFDSELSINRNEVMNISKIGNANTYTTALKVLHSKGYIVYNPSHSHLIGSKVTMCIFGNSSGKTTAQSSDTTTAYSTAQSSDTLYKLLNKETIKLINDNATLLNDNLENWINSHNNIPPAPKVASFDFDKYLIWFNETTNRKFIKISKKTQTSYLARLKEGYTKEHIKQAVINCLNDKFHKDNPKYLTPEFMSRAEKIEMYINKETTIAPTKPKETRSIAEQLEAMGLGRNAMSK